MRSRLLLGAAAVFVLTVVPAAVWASEGDPQAGASVNKKVKKLKTQVSSLEQRLAALEEERVARVRRPGPPAAT